MTIKLSNGVVDDLTVALKPFAAVAEHDIGSDEHDSDKFQPARAHNRAPMITVGDLRRALAVTHSHGTSTPAMSDETVPSEEFVLVPVAYAKPQRASWTMGQQFMWAEERTEDWMREAYTVPLYDRPSSIPAMAWIKEADAKRLQQSPKPLQLWVFPRDPSDISGSPYLALSASHLAKEGGEAGAVEPIEKHRIANRLRGMFDMSVSSEGDFNRLTPAGFRLLRQAHDALIAPDEAVAPPAPNFSPAAKGGDAVRDHAWWLAVAKAAGEAGVRYRTNRALCEFLGAVAALSTPTEGPASQTEGVGGDAGARRKRASELMAPIMELSEDELILLRYSLPVETLARLRAALTPPETAEAVPDDLTAAYMAGIERGRDELRAERDEAVKALETARAAAASDPSPATDDRERLVEALRPFANAVFNDNGDMTVSPVTDYDAYVNAYFACRAALAPEASQ